MANGLRPSAVVWSAFSECLEVSMAARKPIYSAHCTCVPGNDVGILCQLATLVLRLSLMRGAPKHYLHPVLGHAVIYLKQLEPSIQLCGQSGEIPVSMRELASPPHRAQGLHIIPSIANSFLAWGKIVEAFWRVSMALDHRTPVWDTLTSRLLIWRGIVGEDGSPVGEWARKESIGILRTYS